MNATNVTESSVPILERYIEASVMVVITGLALVGNVSIWIISLHDRRSRQHVSTWLLLCLSMADILVALVNMPMVIVNLIYGTWVFDDMFCVGLGFISMLTFVASVMSLASISFYRYALACHASRVNTIYTRNNAILIIAATWILSVFLSVPPLFGWGKYDYLPGQSICFCQWRTSISYTYFMVAVCFGGPCSAMAFCYTKILRKLAASRTKLLGHALGIKSETPTSWERSGTSRQDTSEREASTSGTAEMVAPSHGPSCHATPHVHRSASRSDMTVTFQEKGVPVRQQDLTEIVKNSRSQIEGADSSLGSPTYLRQIAVSPAIHTLNTTSDGSHGQSTIEGTTNENIVWSSQLDQEVGSCGKQQDAPTKVKGEMMKGSMAATVSPGKHLVPPPVVSPSRITRTYHGVADTNNPPTSTSDNNVYALFGPNGGSNGITSSGSCSPSGVRFATGTQIRTEHDIASRLKAYASPKRHNVSRKMLDKYNKVSPVSADSASSGVTSGRQSPSRESRSWVEMRLTISFLVVILVFVVCWLPFCITMFLSVHMEEPVPRVPDMLTLMLGCLNSCCNPIIYGIMNQKYKAGYIRLFCCKKEASS